MTVSQDEIVEAIAKLNDLTRRRSLLWTSIDVTPEASSSAKSSYTADFEGRTLRITEYDRAETRSEWARVMYDHPRSHRPSRYTLDILDSQGNPVYQFPDIGGVADLFASARAQSVDVEGLIKSLLTAE